MKFYRFTVTPRTAFGTELLGEMLFGQLCWAERLMHSQEHLQKLLEGYCSGKPFAVISDAFPWGYVPLPCVPSAYWEASPDVDRKQIKKRCWLPVDALSTSFPTWQKQAKTAPEAFVRAEGVAMHNTISRLTQTTGENEFAPYQSEQIWFAPDTKLDVYALIDDRMDGEEMLSALAYIGSAGYGRDATAGLGKFDVQLDAELPLPAASKNRLTLASCDLSQMALAAGSFYKIRTHFGRHAAPLVAQGNPFKRPLLLAEKGAVLAFEGEQACPFAGRGIPGVSYAHPETVHQGYSPVLALPQ